VGLAAGEHAQSAVDHGEAAWSRAAGRGGPGCAELHRYSLGTKNKNLYRAADGSLTLTASAAPPAAEELRANWLPAPAGPLSLYLRAYWPGPPILDGAWTPPPVRRLG